ncbi:hypothetical protein B566_EDAN005235 [Ephemera danica]|nr:hypothetical protein B566_EDAN005235 [Ephemera danica]
MAKNTSSSAFRKIDVDQYNEDNYKEDDQGELQSPPIGPDEAEVNTMLSQYPFHILTLCFSFFSLYNIKYRKLVDALKTVLRNAPLGSKNQQLKDAALALTMRVLLTVKTSQVEEVVSALEPELVDVLMKYVYKGFEMPSEGSSGQLLVWHEKAFAAGGLGSIMRVLTDSKRA